MTKQIREIILLVLLIASIAAANVVYVDCNGPNDPGSGIFDDPFRQIQTGIDAAGNGDTVQISPGVYTGVGNYNLDPNGKSITICSSDPNNPYVTAGTVIDANLAGRGFYIHHGEDTNCVISGLTIKNAYTADIGAGIYCYNSNPTIVNCVLKNNHAEVYAGGAIACEESNSLFVNCTISNNFGSDGGGLECWSGSPILTNCIISNNHAMRFGGGVDCYGESNPHLVNCTLINNTAEPNGAGGAVSLWGSGINIKNSILWANKASNGTQLYLQFNSSASVSYCDVQGGISDVCAPESDVHWGSGNIDSDPCFASFNPEGDPNLWDFHLKSTAGRWDPNSSKWVIDANLSPCVDAGDPNSDWTGEPWPNGKRINMGTYGGTDQASKSGNIADFDVNGKVDFVDFAQFAEQWNQDTNAIEDMNKDEFVDVLDLDILTDNWLWEKQ